jgi:VWFA-related protein
MELLAGLGRTLGFSFAAGINLYATVALLGLASRFGWVALPPQYKAFDHDWVIYTAIALYLVEFLADKIPWIDTIWDALHTFIRPVGGALIAVTTLGDASPAVTGLTALLGGLVAGSTHITKAGTRVVANTSPEPFSNWFLSFGEDLFVVGLGFVALKYPIVALAVCVGLLALMVIFAAAIVRAFRRRFRRTSPVSAALTVAVLLAIGLGGSQPLTALQATPPAATPPAGQQEQRPVFRAGANFVRVDVFATKNGQPVEDLKVEEFEVSEDNTPQKVETFEHVKIEGGGDPSTRVEPRTVRESREMAADPRARVFVLFLDTYHVHQTAAYNVRRPLTNMLNRVIGPDDLIAVMTPDMAASDITFTRRTDKVGDMLLRAGMWGQREEVIKRDPIDAMYEQCYPPPAGRSTSVIAEEMIQRRREKMTLDALEELVKHLGGIREERKAILLVSEGWLLFRPNRSLAEMGGTPQRPGVYVGPDGRLTTTDSRNMAGTDTYKCDQDRVALAQIDDDRRFRDILNEANRYNASFYPIEPRGLVVFDTDIGPNPPPTLEVDAAMLRNRHDALLTAALNTDGLAVLDSNDIDKGLKRVVADLSSYYLVGYTSTNSKADGRFRSIKVRITRPGVEVRARKGYQAPTETEVALRAAAATAPPVSAETAALTKAVASLEAIRPSAIFRLTVSSGWWMPAGEPVKGQPQGAEPALWILGEVDAKARGGEDWLQGGEADVALTTEAGTAIVRYTVPIPAGTGRFLTRFPRTAEDVWLDPGAYTLRVRAKPAGGGLPTTDTSRLTVPAAPGTDALVLGQPVYARRIGGAAAEDVPTADRRFRRTERIVVEVTTSLAPESVSAELLDRSGKPLPLPVAAATAEKDFVRWVRAELTLAPLAAGDYVIRITTRRGSEQVQMLAAFRIVP